MGAISGEPFSSRARLVLVIALFATILSPSTNLLLFRGLPLDEPVPFLTGLSLLPVLFSTALRRGIFRTLGSSRVGFLAAGIVVAMGLKSILAAHAPTVGFEGCYGSPGLTPEGECELTYSGIRIFPRGSRLDQTLDFGAVLRTSGAMTPNPHTAGALIAGVAETNWNLSYLNSLRFNVYDAPGDAKSEHLPMRVVWTGHIENPAARRLEVNVIGSIVVAIDDEEWTVKGIGATAARSIITVPSGYRRVRVDYGYPAEGDDHHLVAAERPFAMVKLRYLSDPTGHALTVFAPAQASLSWRLLALVTDLLIGGAALVLIAAAVTCLHPSPWTMAFAPLLAGLVYLAPSSVPELGLLPFGILCAIVPLIYADRAQFGASGAFLLLAVLAFAATVAEAPTLSAVIYRRPGSDWQTYESFARDILVTGSLRAGEDVFHYQPGFRYLLFALRMVVGDNDVLLATAARLATVWPFALLYFAGRTSGEANRKSWLFAYALVGCAILLVTSRWLQSALLIGVSEWPTWGLLPMAASLLFFSQHPVAWAAGASMLAFSALVRVNQLPGIALIVLAVLTKNRSAPRTALLALAMPFVVAAVLIPAHNLRFGGRAELLPTERGDPDVFAVAPGELSHALADPTVGARLLRQVRAMAFVEDLPPAPIVIARCAWLIYASWVVSLVIMARNARRDPRLWRLILGLAPVAYLAPFILIKHYNFYPRHLIIGVLAACVSTVVVMLTSNAHGRREGPVT